MVQTRGQTGIEYLLITGGVIVLALSIGAYLLSSAKIATTKAVGNVSGTTTMHAPAVSCTHHISGSIITVDYFASDTDGDLNKLTTEIKEGSTTISTHSYSLSDGSDHKSETISAPNDGASHTYSITAKVWDTKGNSNQCSLTVTYNPTVTPTGSAPIVAILGVVIDPATSNPIEGYSKTALLLDLNDPDDDINEIKLAVYDSSNTLVTSKDEAVTVTGRVEMNFPTKKSDWITLPAAGDYNYVVTVMDSGGHKTTAHAVVTATSGTVITFSTCKEITSKLRDPTVKHVISSGGTVLAILKNDLDVAGYNKGADAPAQACIYANGFDYKGRLTIDLNGHTIRLEHTTDPNVGQYGSLVAFIDTNGITLSNGHIDCMSKWGNYYGDRNACVYLTDSNAWISDLSVTDAGSIASAHNFYAVPIMLKGSHLGMRGTINTSVVNNSAVINTSDADENDVAIAMDSASWILEEPQTIWKISYSNG